MDKTLKEAISTFALSAYAQEVEKGKMEVMAKADVVKEMSGIIMSFVENTEEPDDTYLCVQALAPVMYLLNKKIKEADEDPEMRDKIAQTLFLLNDLK